MAGDIKVYETSFSLDGCQNFVWLGSGLKIKNLPDDYIKNIGFMIDTAYKKGRADKYIKPKSFIERLKFLFGI
jgi:hypothetical protein